MNEDPRPNPHLKEVLSRRRGNHDPLLAELAKMPKERQLELFKVIQELELEVDYEKRKRKQGRVY